MTTNIAVSTKKEKLIHEVNFIFIDKSLSKMMVSVYKYDNTSILSIIDRHHYV